MAQYRLSPQSEGINCPGLMSSPRFTPAIFLRSSNIDGPDAGLRIDSQDDAYIQQERVSSRIFFQKAHLFRSGPFTDVLDRHTTPAVLHGS